MITLADRYHDTFLKTLEKLNYDWFEKKRVEFQLLGPDPDSKNLVFVDVGHSPVYGTEAEYFENTETGEVEVIRKIDSYENYEDKTTISLADFCGCYTPLRRENGWGSFPELDDQPHRRAPNYNYREIADELMHKVIKYASPKANAEETKSFARKAIADFERALEKFTEDKPTDTVYRTVLKNFSTHFKRNLEKVYSLELLHTSEKEPVQYLDFALKLSELAAFLELLHSKGIIIGDRTSISKFAATHFRFQYNGQTRSPRNHNEFSEEWGKQSKTECPGKKKIYRKLQEAIGQ